MATGNFHNVNASKVYAVLLNSEQPVLDEQGNETEETEVVAADEFAYESLKEDVESFLSEFEGFDTKSTHTSKEALRSFPSEVIGSICNEKYFGDICVEIFIHAILRSAYYEGANLDWEIEVFVDGLETDMFEIEDLKESFEGGYGTAMNAGMRTIQAKNAKKWIDTQKEEMANIVEQVFKKVSTPMTVVARFSNGETMYEKA